MITKNEVKIQVRAYSVTLKDLRTGETVKDAVILTKEQLKAYDDTGLTLGGILTALYERKGYRVVNISAPVKRLIKLFFGASGDIAYSVTTAGETETGKAAAE